MNSLFCEKCESNLDVTMQQKKVIEVIKNVPDFIKNWNKLNKDIHYELEFDIEELIKYLTAKKNKNKTKILEIYEDINKTKLSKIFNFICYNCNSVYPLLSPTLLFIINYKTENNIFNENINNIIYCPYLPRTKDYICINKNCPSQTNLTNKEAVLYKLKNYYLYYICTICKSYWLPYSDIKN